MKFELNDKIQIRASELIIDRWGASEMVGSGWHELKSSAIKELKENIFLMQEAEHSHLMTYEHE